MKRNVEMIWFEARVYFIKIDIHKLILLKFPGNSLILVIVE